MRMAPACAVVVFGASGDLARRKLVPALYEMLREGLFNERSYIVGFARSAMSDEQFRQFCREALEHHARKRPIDEELWLRMEPRLFYLRGDYDSPQDHQRLAEMLAEKDRQAGETAGRMYYLATPPEKFEPLIRRLGESRRRATGKGHEAWVRVIIEKPFGRDSGSADALNALLHEHFSEEEIFRIDHYLGKETVQNLLVLRFANAVFEPVWNHRYVDHVQVTVGESLGVGGRGGYYDRSGALRDMMQNHMLQLLALAAMEPPVALEAGSIRDEKVKVFRAIRPVRPDEAAVRGQYGPGEAHGRRTGGYLKEKDVDPASMTETFAAVKLYIDNWRWSGTPFYLRTGKFLPEKLSEIVVRFRSPPLTLFQKQCESPVYPNDLVIRVQPDEGISLRLNGKVPGSQMNIQAVALNFLYSTTFHRDPPEAYERLIHDAINGDQTLFIRGDEAEAAWAVIDPIIRGWQESKQAVEEYAPGSWGPRRAMDLIEKDGRRWLHSNGAPEPVIACWL
jgi:glucose-6-phosphate 1-dehydrogenase